MRTYLQTQDIEHPRGGTVQDFVLVCNCGAKKRLAEVWASFRRGDSAPLSVNSINLHLLAKCMAEFNYEHSSCPDERPEPTA